MNRHGGVTKREAELGRAQFAGYHDDARGLVRALVERRCASMVAIRAAFAQGAKMRAAGVRCTCHDCAEVRPCA